MANILSKQVGPLPLGAWVAVVGGGLGLAYYANRNQSSGSDTALSDREVLAEPGVGVGGGQFIESPPEFMPQPTESLATWIVKAVAALINAGVSPLAAEAAVRKYATNQTLSQAEAALVNKAITLVGQPPAGELDIPPDVTPIPTPTPAPTKPKYVIPATFPNSARANRTFYVSGKLSPSPKRQGIVQVYARRLGTTGWTWKKTGIHWSTGTFKIGVVLTRRQSYQLKLVSEGASVVKSIRIT